MAMGAKCFLHFFRSLPPTFPASFWQPGRFAAAALHVSLADALWFASDPERQTLASPPWSDPFLELSAGLKPFQPWCRSYLSSDATDSAADWGKKLLYDLRHSVLHSGLLHTCRRGTCDKGLLGRLGFCRLGFWHWEDVSTAESPHTWQRQHGHALCARPSLGSSPPATDFFQTERHHCFFGRVNPVILLCVKCNHDVSLLQRFPHDYLALRDKAVETIVARMSASMRSLFFCDSLCD